MADACHGLAERLMRIRAVCSSIVMVSEHRGLNAVRWQWVNGGKCLICQQFMPTCGD